MASIKYDLSGRVALITGAAGLLGIEHAFALLECGSRVILTDVCENGLSMLRDRLSHQVQNSQVFIMYMDVTEPESIYNVFGWVKNNKLNVDILINNAAIDSKVSGQDSVTDSYRFENISLQQWNSEISVGLTGAFNCSKIFGKAMVEGAGGVILNVASDLSVISPDQRIYRKAGLPEDKQPVKPITYSVIKTGLIGLTRYLATYWAGRGVRCNAISPGGIFVTQNDEFVERLSYLIPLGRMAHHDEYRAAIQFMCSDASAYMNGHNLIMDGGRSIL